MEGKEEKERRKGEGKKGTRRGKSGVEGRREGRRVICLAQWWYICNIFPLILRDPELCVQSAFFRHFASYKEESERVFNSSSYLSNATTESDEYIMMIMMTMICS